MTSILCLLVARRRRYWRHRQRCGDSETEREERKEKGFRKFRRKSNNRLIHHTWLRMCHVRSESSFFSFIRSGIAMSKLCSNSLRILKLENISNVESWSCPKTCAASSCTFNVNSTRTHPHSLTHTHHLTHAASLVYPFLKSEYVCPPMFTQSGWPLCGPRRRQENVSEGMSQTKLFSLYKRITIVVCLKRPLLGAVDEVEAPKNVQSLNSMAQPWQQAIKSKNG